MPVGTVLRGPHRETLLLQMVKWLACVRAAMSCVSRGGLATSATV